MRRIRCYGVVVRPLLPILTLLLSSCERPIRQPTTDSGAAADGGASGDGGSGSIDGGSASDGGGSASDGGTGTDSGTGTDGGETTDGGSEDPAFWSQPWVAAHTLPASRGLVFERDLSFEYEGATVPTIVVTPDGYEMLMTWMEDRGSLYRSHSADGLTWETSPTPILTPDDFGGACGIELLDAAVLYLDDGSYRLIVECSLNVEGSVRIFGAATSTDGQTWVAEPSWTWEGTANDFGTISVPEVLRTYEGDWLLYYLGDMAGNAGPELGDGVRVAQSSDEGATWVSLADTNQLAAHDTDPFPVHLDDGSVRLYHTHPVMWGRLGTSLSTDGISFTLDGPLQGLGVEQKDQEMWLDPVVLRLPDDRIVIYTTRLVEDGSEVGRPTIGRAFATD
jgi:hypothetical protein